MTSSPLRQLPDIHVMLDRMLVLAVAVWTALVAGMLGGHLLETRDHIEHIAHETSKENIQKDILYRAWAAERGGVYAAVSEKTPPNPYLKMVRERDITTPSGRKLTLVNPEHMTRQVHEMEKARSTIKGHITSARPVRPENRPDAWEQKALHAMEGGEKEFGEIVTQDEAPHYRLMLPLFVEQPCLKCHAAQGYKLGDLHGGISAAVPMKLLDDMSRDHIISEVRHFAVVWFIGIVGMLLVRPFVKRRIAERDRAVEALRESKELYRNLIEVSPDAIYVHAEGRFIFSNAQGARLLGAQRPEDLFGRRIMDSIHPDHRDLLGERLRRVGERDGTAPLKEEIYVRLNGSSVHVETSMIPLSYGGQSAVLVVARDISKRREIERLLRKAYAQYRTIVDTALEGIIAIDAGGGITLVNTRVADLLGYAVEEMLGQPVYGFVHEDERSAHQAQTELRARGISSQFERRFRRKDGGVIWTFVSASPLFDDQGVFQGSFAMFNDITERKQAEETLRRSELRLREAQHLAHMGNWEWDIEEELLAWSDETYRIFGREPGTFVPSVEQFEATIHPDDREEYLRRKDRMLSEKTPASIEHRILLPGGEVRHVQLRAQLELNGQGAVRRVIGTVQDITDRKKSEEQRTVLESQLLQSQKIESVGRLAGGIAHDINNMLMPILGYAEMLSLELSENDGRKADAEAIIRSAERVRDITRQLLAFARKQTLEVRLLDLNKVVSGFEKMLRRTLRENIPIETKYASSPCLMRGDSGQIEQVILNLAINAQDAMPNGGALTVEIEPVVLDDTFAHAHPGALAGDYVAMRFTDTGVGMDRETQARIFEPFYTTKEIGRGTGLGLSMVYGIVKQHGGYIDVLSEPGRGSTFIVYFPKAEKEAAQGVSVETATPAPGGTETLLVVEDQQDVLNVVAQMLTAGGYQVLRAADGNDAVSIAGMHPGKIDLLVTDVIMPGMNGRELYEALSRARQGLKVLYMSGYPADVISTQGVLHTGTDFIQKPCSFKALMTKVRGMLDGSEGKGA